MRRVEIFGFRLGRHHCAVDDGGEGAAPPTGGGSGGGANGGGQPNGGTGAGDGGKGETPPDGTAGEDTGGDGQGDGQGDGKPYLGEPKPGAQNPDGGKTPPNGEGGQNGDGEQKPATDEDYIKALVKDEKSLGDEAGIQLDTELYRAVLPTLRECGVSPEAANRLANALAKAQIDDARARMRSRLEYFERMKQESLRTYTPGDFEAINAGIDRWFKPGGTMNQTIRNSELGADPEFLALMLHLGKSAREDSAAGAAEGGGASGYVPGSTAGFSKGW